MFDANIITNVTWGASVDTSPANSPQIPVNPRVTARRVHNDFLCLRHQERLWPQQNLRNTLVNTRVYRQGGDMDDPVTK